MPRVSADKSACFVCNGGCQSEVLGSAAASGSCSNMCEGALPCVKSWQTPRPSLQTLSCCTPQESLSCALVTLR